MNTGPLSSYLYSSKVTILPLFMALPQEKMDTY